MNCNCCTSEETELDSFGLTGFITCKNCGFLHSVNNNLTRELLSSHYGKNDPHSEVAYAKKKFFDAASKYLSDRIIINEKSIIDIGCGYGYFLEHMLNRNWKCSGVEIYKGAAECAKDKMGKKNIFEGKLKEANYNNNFFDAITLWDVLAVVDDPYDELKESYRILKKGGIIGLRTRNVYFQKFAYLLYKPLKKIFLKLGFKEPYVFNKFCFSPRSIQILLSRIGFKNIEISNSLLTYGDPYQHSYYSLPIKIVKALTEMICRIISLMSGGQIIIGPALLIWAEKP